MNHQSLSCFTKISIEMDRLSYLINKEEISRQQLKNALEDQASSDSSHSSQVLEQFFEDYQNPTTQSIAFEESECALESLQDCSSTLHRNSNEPFIWNQDQDEMSTIIVPHSKVHQKQQPVVNTKLKCSAFLNEDQPEMYFKTSYANNATTSMPSQKQNLNHHKFNDQSVKASSLFKDGQNQCQNLKIRKIHKKQNSEKVVEPVQEDEKPQDQWIKSRFTKINREELIKLQTKKLHKKSELSTNRKKKTERELVNHKSLTQILKNTHNYNSVKSSALYQPNSSCKTFQKKPIKQFIKPSADKNKYHQEWVNSVEKTNKKLNRVNICKLQQNLKKTDKKLFMQITNSKKVDIFKDKNVDLNEKGKENKPQLKLHFTETEGESAFHKIIGERHLSKRYNNVRQNYKEVCQIMTKCYLLELRNECQMRSEEGNLKLKIMGLVLCFFDQFSSNGFYKNFRNITPQETLTSFQHPQKIMAFLCALPEMIQNTNQISCEIYKTFNCKYIEINEHLDQDLQSFLLKKTKIYRFTHSLHQYISFLVSENLVEKTKRTKVLSGEENCKAIEGFYSNRSERENKRKGTIDKIQDSNFKLDRYESNKKITIVDEQTQNGSCKTHRKTEGVKGGLKKLFK